MANDKQIAANRRNAQLSTGPRTGGGRRRSSLNATFLGTTAKRMLIEGEDEKELEQLRKKLFADLAPVGAFEQMLVQRMLTQLWRLNRHVDAETQLYDAVRHDEGLSAIAQMYLAKVADLPGEFPFEASPELKEALASPALNWTRAARNQFLADMEALARQIIAKHANNGLELLRVRKKLEREIDVERIKAEMASSPELPPPLDVANCGARDSRATSARQSGETGERQSGETGGDKKRPQQKSEKEQKFEELVDAAAKALNKAVRSRLKELARYLPETSGDAIALALNLGRAISRLHGNQDVLARHQKSERETENALYKTFRELRAVQAFRMGVSLPSEPLVNFNFNFNQPLAPETAPPEPRDVTPFRPNEHTLTQARQRTEPEHAADILPSSSTESGHQQKLAPNNDVSAADSEASTSPDGALRPRRTRSYLSSVGYEAPKPSDHPT